MWDSLNDPFYSGPYQRQPKPTLLLRVCDGLPQHSTVNYRLQWQGGTMERGTPVHGAARPQGWRRPNVASITDENAQTHVLIQMWALFNSRCPALLAKY